MEHLCVLILVVVAYVWWIIKDYDADGVHMDDLDTPHFSEYNPTDFDDGSDYH